MSASPPGTVLPTPVRTGEGFWSRLAQHGNSPALVTPDATVTYAQLADRVAATAARLGPTPRLVLLAGANDVDTVVAYLAALVGRHPVILVPGDGVARADAVAATYDPDVVVTHHGEVVERRPGTVHDLHPDLALLLSTSGSTGSPKLVRLSHRNLEANATAIADYLRIRATDVAATTLPMHYCYGLSVLHSHLLAGATVLLTDLSVVDACFWDAVREHEVSSFATVPYTFDLLDRVGFDAMELPSLRYVTQAGGRLAPDRVRQYAALGRRRGWDLFVMYGQTEATARMAYLPPDLADARPGSIGHPVPGGSFTLEPIPELPLDPGPDGVEVGELLYAGDNVMLGYATAPADLARGREVDVLRTGDVARRSADGLYEVIGRRNRFAKVYGLRIDLDQVERLYAERGHVVLCTDGGDRLLLGVDTSARGADPETLLEVAKEAIGLPRSAVQVLGFSSVPRLPSGKPDYRAIASAATAAATPAPIPAASVGAEGIDERRAALRSVLAEVLGRPGVCDDDSFVSLEGDSLSYVEAAARVESVLGSLPAGWHALSVTELAGRPSRVRRGRTLETNVLLRAVAIVMIVATHANLLVAVGGAHVLLGVAGFNFGRFHLSESPRRDRTRHLVGSIARIVVPSVLWLGAVAVLSGDIGWTSVLLVNGFVGPASWAEPQWWYWFVEALVWTLAGLAVLLAVPWVDRLERRWSFWLPIALAVGGLLTRYDLVELTGGDEIHRASVVFWLFALGWATVKAALPMHRVLVSLLVVATVPGFFGDPVREAVVVVGMLLLVWLGSVRVPVVAARVAGVLASASLYIYLAHWQIYPHLEDRLPFVATLLSLLGGLAFWLLATKAAPRVRSMAKRVSGRPVR